jgi:hypothetical protein
MIIKVFCLIKVFQQSKVKQYVQIKALKYLLNCLLTIALLEWHKDKLKFQKLFNA